MFKQLTALYRSLVACLLLCVLAACVALPPYQSISEAKQAVAAAESLIQQSVDTNNQAWLAADQASYQLAKTALQRAETALSAQQYSQAATWSANSKRHAQIIIKRHQPPQQSSTNNIRFRY